MAFGCKLLLALDFKALTDFPRITARRILILVPVLHGWKISGAGVWTYALHWAVLSAVDAVIPQDTDQYDHHSWTRSVPIGEDGQ